MRETIGGAFTVPFIGWRGKVLPEWIDANGHMNSLIYPQLFHDATWPFFREFLMEADYIEKRAFSIFQREFRISFENELMLGDQIEVRCWLYAHDAKRIHHIHELWVSAGDGTPPCRVAFGEYMSLHVDMTTRRSAPFPDEVLARLNRMAEAYAHHPKPHGARQAIGIPPRRGLD
jgi:acyl-CoA thioester hydrolase